MRRNIPNYALYGDQAQPGWVDSFNIEWIPQRSKPYNWHIRPHIHDAFLQILYLQSGSMELLLNDVKWSAVAPCLALIPAQTVHGIDFTPDTDGPAVTVAQKPLESIAALVMPELLQVIRTPAVIAMPSENSHSASLMTLFREIEREWRMHAVGQSAAGMSLLTAVLVQIARIGNALGATPAVANPRKAGQIEKFRSMVDKHFRKRLSIDAYANELGVTAGQLSRLCRDVLGVSALDVINARIVHEAQRELVYGGTSIKQIATALGFADEAYFGRFFRKQTGIGPRAFREQARARLIDGDKHSPVAKPPGF
ncbi:helix-turn-helix domain-containing protein [Azoarcus sp. KH32C]|uniref:helix-turn-helix domain-containing protein n=1 Tax=Azoarcus sp. KH32C TaxID=748247 RepID=UPI0002385C04|nr:helix-turn-helix domain-containing protein [Azoarcus sp. KH32C]BAL27383.1 transcriptional regulator, AraC family [Azoarcus sp. KH32C]